MDPPLSQYEIELIRNLGRYTPNIQVREFVQKQTDHREGANKANKGVRRIFPRDPTDCEALGKCVCPLFPYSRQMPRSLRRMKFTRWSVSGVGISVSILVRASSSFRPER